MTVDQQGSAGSGPHGSAVRRDYADTPFGQLHYATAGSGVPILLLHQTPRSWDEFRELIPLLSAHHRVVAMDMLGFGASPTAIETLTVPKLARAAFALMAALGIDRFHVLGHHTGAAVALEMAATRPETIITAILSASTFLNADFRAPYEHEPHVMDFAPRAEDGSHLATLWNTRLPYYPSPAAPLLNRFMSDALRLGVDAVQGHAACTSYVMEDRIGLVTAPVLLLDGTDDPFSDAAPVRDALTGAASVEIVAIKGGRVPLMEQCAPEVALAVRAFLAPQERDGV